MICSSQLKLFMNAGMSHQPLHLHYACNYQTSNNPRLYPVSRVPETSLSKVEETEKEGMKRNQISFLASSAMDF
jgi:hypothetical protein